MVFNIICTYHNQLPELYLTGDCLSILFLLSFFLSFFLSSVPPSLLPVDALFLPGVGGGDRRREISD